MNNQLMKKEDIPIFDKIKIFFRNIFFKKDISINEIKEIENNKLAKDVQFEQNLKGAISTTYEKENELKRLYRKIEDNPNILEKLSEDKLDRVIQYYQNATASKREKIKKLKMVLEQM